MKTSVRSLLAVVVGLTAFVALFPFSGDDRDPPTFRSIFGYDVPSGDIWPALLAGVVAAVLAWILLGKRARR